MFAHNNNNNTYNNIRLNEIFISQWTEVARDREGWGGGVPVSGMEYDYDFTYRFQFGFQLGHCVNVCV